MGNELKFLEETLKRNCFFCVEPSEIVVEGRNGDYIYRLPCCPTHKEEVKKKVLQQIGVAE